MVKNEPHPTNKVFGFKNLFLLYWCVETNMEDSSQMDFPKPPKAQDVELNQDDISFILRTTLSPDHHDDPVVIKFISEYLMSRDIRQAANFAGIDIRSAKNLRNRKDIHLAITKITDQAVMKYGFDAEEIVARAREIADLDPADFVDKATGVAVMNIHDVPIASRRALKSMKVKNLYVQDPNGMDRLEGHLVEFTFWDKSKAIELVGREKSVFKETKIVEHEASKNMKELLLAGLNRADQRILSAREVVESGVVEIEGKVESE